MTCGGNEKGQLGYGDLEGSMTLTPVKVGDGQQEVKVTKAVGGWDFTIILTSELLVTN